MGLTWFAKGDEADGFLGFNDLEAMEPALDEAELAAAIERARLQDEQRRRAEIARRFAA